MTGIRSLGDLSVDEIRPFFKSNASFTIENALCTSLLLF